MHRDYERKVARTVRETYYAPVSLEIKQMQDNGVFAGYASVFDIVDSQRDIICHGAFAHTLISENHQVKLLWHHAMDEPIGVIEALYEDRHGLYIKGRLLMDVARAREAYSLLKANVVTGLSIGYSPRRYRTDPDTGIRHIQAVDLWEVSLVTFPANQAAQVTVVKSKSTDNTIALLHALQRATHILHI